MNRFTKFNDYVHQSKVIYKDRIFSFPLNLYTIQELWGIDNKEDALKVLEEKKVKIDNPQNMEEYCLSVMGEEIYSIFIEGYTTKQWNRSPIDLPASIVKRNPIKLEFNENFFTDKYTGIPIGGYTQIFDKLLDGIEVKLNTFYDDSLKNIANNIIYTGCIDEFFDYKFGRLEYRSLVFKHELKNIKNFQDYACVNYTDYDIPYTRITEHKHFERVDTDSTILNYEYSSDHGDPAYPINTERNAIMYKKYSDYAKGFHNIYFGGRLGKYQYINMDQTVKMALDFVERIK